MPLTTTAVTDRVGILLQDTTATRWPVAERLQYATDAIREICLFRPDACAKAATVPLSAGTKQALPVDGVLLIDVLRNMGTGGATPGRAPRRVQIGVLDAHVPDWHKSAASATAIHWLADPQNQKTFYVYPPQPAADQGSLEIVYAAAPAELTDGAPLPLDDVWMPAIVNYVLYRCYAKDADFAGNAALATAYYQAFSAQIGGRSGAEEAVSAN